MAGCGVALLHRLRPRSLLSIRLPPSPCSTENANRSLRRPHSLHSYFPSSPSSRLHFSTATATPTLAAYTPHCARCAIVFLDGAERTVIDGFTESFSLRLRATRSAEAVGRASERQRSRSRRGTGPFGFGCHARWRGRRDQAALTGRSRRRVEVVFGLRYGLEWRKGVAPSKVHVPSALTPPLHLPLFPDLPSPSCSPARTRADGLLGFSTPQTRVSSRR